MIRRLLLLLLLVSCGTAGADESTWATLRQPGAIALMRHANAPGTGDPAGFRLGDCSTQRNLSVVGRAQAARVGRTLKMQGIGASIYSSEWCRTLDTARLLDMGPVQPMPALNSLIGNPAGRTEQIAETRRFINAWRGETLILVTHQVNITALTGLPVADSEMIVLRRGPDGYEVAGRLPPKD